MSRTTKDRPSKLRWGDYSQDYIYLENYHHRLGKTTKPKVRRTKDTEWQWYSTAPSWWNNLFHTKPIRGNFRKFTLDIVKSKVEAIEDMLEPSDSKSPHKYYY